MHGSFFWFDLMTTDVTEAARFYADVVGWEARASGVEGKNYSVFSVGGNGVAGLMPLFDEVKRQGVPPCWSGYIAVDDVDDMTTRVRDAGGSIIKPPSEVPGVIRFAAVADPQGARFLIGKGLSRNPPPPVSFGAPGTVGWHELYAADEASALRFYEKLFGWTSSRVFDMGPAGAYRIFEIAGREIGGVMTKPASLPTACWGFYFTVSRLEDAIARVTRGGGTILNGPIEVPGGHWIAQCADPQNAFFALVSAAR